MMKFDLSEEERSNHPCNPTWDRLSMSAGYFVVYCGEHPNAWSTGYVLLHRAVVESVIGRVLSRSEVVHHVNGDKLDNTKSNLVLMSNSEHARLHHPNGRKKIVTLTCDECGIEFAREKRNVLARKKAGCKHVYCSRSCSGTATRRMQLASVNTA